MRLCGWRRSLFAGCVPQAGAGRAVAGAITFIWGQDAEMLVGEARSDATTGCAGDEAELQQVGFVDILDGLWVFAGTGSQRFQTDGTATELLDDGKQQIAVGLVEAQFVDFQSVQRCLR